MEPREVFALYDGYEWKRKRELGAMAYLFWRLLNRIPLHEKLLERSDLDLLVKMVEQWQPDEDE